MFPETKQGLDEGRRSTHAAVKPPKREQSDGGGSTSSITRGLLGRAAGYKSIPFCKMHLATLTVKAVVKAK